jgi:hypothetical protein
VQDHFWDGPDRINVHSPSTQLECADVQLPSLIQGQPMQAIEASCSAAP